MGRAERRPAREHGRSRRRDRQPPPAARARASSTSAAYVEACRDHGYAGPWGVEVLSEELRNKPHRRHLPARLRDDRLPVRAREELRMSATGGVKPLDRDRLVWIYTPDAAHPGVRGARQAHLRGAPGRDPRPHAPGRRRRGVDRRLDRDARPGRPVPDDLPLPRLSDRAAAPTRKAIMAEIYGRKDGLCKGLGGSMHLTDV